MRDATQSSSTIVTSMSRIDRAICHRGGNCEAIRRNMVIGAHGGNIEIATDQTEFGLLTMKVIMPKLSQMGTAASGLYCCSSCSVSQVAARPAKRVLYS